MSGVAERCNTYLKEDQGNAAIGTVLEEIFVMDVKRMDRIFIQIDLTGEALTGFEVQGLAHPSGAHQTLYSATGDFTSPAGMVVDASGDLTVLAVGTGWLILDVRSLYEVKLLAKTLGGAGVSQVYAGGN